MYLSAASFNLYLDSEFLDARTKGVAHCAPIDYISIVSPLESLSVVVFQGPP